MQLAVDIGASAPVRNDLGISAKSRDTRGGGAGFRGGDLTARQVRFSLTRTSGTLLFDHAKPAKDQFRTCWCHRGMQGRNDAASVYRRTDGGGARFAGLIRCGSVWLCPVCALPVSEERRHELERAIKAWVKKGGHVYLATFTFPHEKDEPLAELLARFSKAMDHFRTGRAYRNMRAAFGVEGMVRALEATWGGNGWHPHFHMLIFGKPGLLADERTIDGLKGAWLDALTKAGLLPASKVTWAWDRALDIRGGAAAAEYIAKFGREEKWGMSSEVTRHQAKIGARSLADFTGHVTPFQILEWAQSGDATACRLWREFADAFHGKRQLVYSAGLKKNLGIADRSDEDIANDDKQRPEEEHQGVINQAQLTVLHQRRALGEFLDLVARYGGDQSDIDGWIDHIATRPKIARGTLIRRGEYGDWDKSDHAARTERMAA